jgi:oxygen-independent coproporphyrinogen III oxidase
MNGIYIHFPYCVHKCSYCDFYSIENLNSRNRFVQNLCNEIVKYREVSGSKINADTLFFGGGTPSLMKPHHIEKIFETLHNNIDFADNTEMTMECNPGTIDIKYMSVYKALGINRISFGVQSFIDRDLKFLERIHSPDDVGKALDIARNAGFENISIDLMFALPDQSLDDWRYNLEKAVELETNHISAYSLIYEPGTPLYEEYISGKIQPQSDDKDAELYEITGEVLTKAGFEQYEVSNYAKPGFKCKHNLKYWSGSEYFGFGPSAHSYIDKRRYWNFRSNHKYFELLEKNELPVEGFEKLSEKQILFEKIYLGLRAEGLNIYELKGTYNIDLYDENEKLIHNLKSEGLLTFDDGVIKLTNKGYFVGDNITVEFAKSLDNIFGE